MAPTSPCAAVRAEWATGTAPIVIRRQCFSFDFVSSSEQFLSGFNVEFGNNFTHLKNIFFLESVDSSKRTMISDWEPIDGCQRNTVPNHVSFDEVARREILPS